MAKKGLWIALAVVAVIAISLYGFFKGTYNDFVALDQQVKSSWAQVENQLQRRYDLIPNLVETVKGYAKQEKDVFIEVTNARLEGGRGDDGPGQDLGEQRAVLGIEPAARRRGKLSRAQVQPEFPQAAG